jgi:hypothetical protein
MFQTLRPSLTQTQHRPETSKQVRFRLHLNRQSLRLLRCMFRLRRHRRAVIVSNTEFDPEPPVAA